MRKESEEDWCGVEGGCSEGEVVVRGGGGGLISRSRRLGRGRLEAGSGELNGRLLGE